MIGNRNAPRFQRVEIKVTDVAEAAIRQRHFEHLIEIAIVEPAVPAD